MKLFLLAFLFFAQPIFACDEHAHAVERFNPKDAKQVVGPTVTLSIKKIHCESCRDKIEAALKKVPAVESVETDIKGRKVTITTNGKIKAGVLLTAVADIGYRANLVQ